MIVGRGIGGRSQRWFVRSDVAALVATTIRQFVAVTPGFAKYLGNLRIAQQFARIVVQQGPFECIERNERPA